MPTPTDRADLDVSALTLMYQLATDPDVYARSLPGETGEELAARRAAAADITDHHLAALARPGTPGRGVAGLAALVHGRVEACTARAQGGVAA